jgi:hypothetical protein
MAERETRTVTGKVELRADEGQPKRLTGYASLFNRETVIQTKSGVRFREVVHPGAFSESITRPDDIRAAFNHDPRLVLGRTTANTLIVREDSLGLYYEIVPPDTSYARDLVVSIERGDITESSFQFEIVNDNDEKWSFPSRGSGELPLRAIKRATLRDVSPVTFPAYEGTSVSMRAESRAKTDDSEVELPKPDHAAEHLAALLALDEAEADG